MVEVFRTNIDTESKADCILERLQGAFPHSKINFDLEDCDNILRMETKDCDIDTNAVIALVMDLGHEIEVLTDTVANTISIN